MIYILTGKDQFRIQRFIDNFRKDFKAEHKEVLAASFSWPGTSFQEVILFLGSARLFAQAKFAVFYAEELERKVFKQFSKEIATISSDPEKVLIIWLNTERKFKPLGIPIKTIKVKHFATLQGSVLEEWIFEVSAELGINLDSRALAWLSEVADGNSEIIYAEVEKFANYKPGGTITLKDIAEAARPLLQPQYFQLVDAILAKKKSEALRRLMLEVKRGSGAFGILAGLTSVFRNLLVLHSANARTSPLLKSSSPFWLKNLFEKSRRLSNEEIKGGFQKLALADWQVKTGRRDALALLEQFIVSWP